MSNDQFSISSPSANILTFFAPQNDWVVRINFSTKTVEIKEGVEWDDAAKLFWEHVMKNAPEGFQKKSEN